MPVEQQVYHGLDEASEEMILFMFVALLFIHLGHEGIYDFEVAHMLLWFLRDLCVGNDRYLVWDVLHRCKKLCS